MKTPLLSLLLLLSLPALARTQVWVPDRGDGTYRNPIIHADYSDPDVIRVGDDFYMVASSFTSQPGIPVLHSKDLVNWRIVNHVYQSLPLERYRKPQHGQGSWAPSIRHHRGRFYVYFCTPEDGLFVATAAAPVWSSWATTTPTSALRRPRAGNVLPSMNGREPPRGFYPRERSPVWTQT